MKKEKYNVYITDDLNNIKINVICDNLFFLNQVVGNINNTIENVFKD